MTTKNTPETFWAKVEKKGSDECWNWTGCLNHANSYGKIKYQGRHYHAHRLAWILTYGPIDSSKTFVCHKCDNPVCCNPSHLFLGDAFTNNRDCIAKGRYKRIPDASKVRGEDCHTAVLTEEKVREIRKLYAEGKLSLKRLAQQFGVTDGTIYQIVSKKTWKHVT